MNKNIYLHIPQPCHENWQQMTPAEKGRFCQSCAKQVVDFTLMSDRQVLDYITKAAGGVCGRFANYQLQRPLVPVKKEKKRVWWMAALMPLMLLVEKAGAQKTAGTPKQADSIVVIKEQATFVSIANRPTARIYTITGTIVDAETLRPIAFASIVTKHGSDATASSEAGVFNMPLKAKPGKATLQVTCVGYEAKNIPLLLNDSTTAINLGVIKCKQAQPPSPDDIIVTGLVAYARKPAKMETVIAAFKKAFVVTPLKICLKLMGK